MLRRVLTTAVLCGLIAALAGCATERSASAPPVPSEEPAPERPGVPLPELLGGAYERGEDGSLAVLDRLGEPRRVEAEPVQNRHDPAQTDTLRTLVYDGLELEVYAVASGRELLQEVRVTGEGYETEQGLGVGSTQADVREALGAPVRTEGDTLIYEVRSSPDDPTPTMLEVHFDGNRVAAMRWSYYVD